MIHWIERQDQLYKTLPRALFFSPTIVVFSALTLLLLLSGVFAPGSLTVTTKDSTHVSLYVISTGNISTPDTPDSTSFFTQGGTQPSGFNASWAGITPRVKGLTIQWFAGQRIPYLPQACGPNCR